MNNLYRIVDKEGFSIPFKLNSVQKEVLENLHNRNIVLKARQLGLSTFAVLYLLDEAIFNNNLSCGIVSYSLEHAQHIFKRIIGHALDTFPTVLKPGLGIENHSAREITFSNGSFLRVDTSLRGGSYQKVLVSEFGKTCARSPQKAEEVVTGTLQAVSEKGEIIIESTGEGTEGFFAEMVLKAHQNKEKITSYDYKLFFFPWYTEPSYSTSQKIAQDIEMADYFKRIEAEGDVILSQEQKNWYSLQEKLLGDKVRQEYPSTVSEAFLSSTDAYFFAKEINEAWASNRCVQAGVYDPLSPVYVAMDIGYNDLTVMTFFQVVHGEVRIFDYYEDNSKDADFYATFLLKDKPFHYTTIFLPHDAQNHSVITPNTFETHFKKLFVGTDTRFHVIKRSRDKQADIATARIMLRRCIFNAQRVKPFLDQCAKYRKTWSESKGCYLPEPFKNLTSHYADALIYTAQAVCHIEACHGQGAALEKHKAAVASRTRMIS
jgi:hypothetical protein